MDNANTRKKLILDQMTLTADVSWQGDGVDVRLSGSGLTGVPIRLEWGFLPGNTLRTEHFVIEAVPGGSMTVCDGTLQAQTGGKDTLTVGTAFARHNAQMRMGGAYPLSQEHFTVFFTELTPFEHVIHIGSTPVFDARFQ